ncbi:MAG TPA: M48 family metallopeptidase [Nitrospiria bacterium]|nr:M48 family metallopeptidase [Nitrospiria bacterium]
MGLTAYQDILSKTKQSTDPEVNAQVRRVGERIARAADRPDYKWEFKVIDDEKTVNAFCLPGGKVAVYTGILPVAQNDSGLATVLSHEVAHALARHGGERISTGLLAEMGMLGLDAVLANQGSSPEAIETINAAYGMGAQAGVILPFSRTQESEADHIGLILMAKAGYNPSAAIGFWERMSATEKGSTRPPEFLSTHPGTGRRIDQIKAWLPEAEQYYRPDSKETKG